MTLHRNLFGQLRQNSYIYAVKSELTLPGASAEVPYTTPLSVVPGIQSIQPCNVFIAPSIADYKSMKPYIDIAEKAKTDAMDAMEKALGGEE